MNNDAGAIPIIRLTQGPTGIKPEIIHTHHPVLMFVIFLMIRIFPEYSERVIQLGSQNNLTKHEPIITTKTVPIVMNVFGIRPDFRK